MKSQLLELSCDHMLQKEFLEASLDLLWCSAVIHCRWSRKDAPTLQLCRCMRVWLLSSGAAEDQKQKLDTENELQTLTLIRSKNIPRSPNNSGKLRSKVPVFQYLPADKEVLYKWKWMNEWSYFWIFELHLYYYIMSLSWIKPAALLSVKNVTVSQGVMLCILLLCPQDALFGFSFKCS